MGRPRSAIASLARLLDKISQPVYAVDSDRRLIFCNQACVDWTGVPADRLVGQLCHFDAATAGKRPAAVAAALGPPPTVWEGQLQSAEVFLPASSVTDKLGSHQGRSTNGPSPPPGHPFPGSQLGQHRGSSSASQTRSNSSVGEGQSSRAEVPRRWQVSFQPLTSKRAQVAIVLCWVGPHTLCDEEAGLPTNSLDEESRRLHEQLRRYQLRLAGRYPLNRLVGESPQMQRVRRQVKLAGESQVATLIVGPRGAGRETVARAIHYFQHRTASRALVPLDGTTLTPELLADALQSLSQNSSALGSSGGSGFLETGSALGSNQPGSNQPGSNQPGSNQPGSNQPGLTQSGSTQLGSAGANQTAATAAARSVPGIPGILVSDIDELSLPAQRLLVGLFQQSPGAVRLLATARAVPGEGTSAEMLPELENLLTTLVISLPALPERREDIPLLAQSFVEEFNAAGGKQLSRCSPEALDLLFNHPWTGDVQELSEVLQEAHSMAIGPPIEASDLPKRIHYARQAAVRGLQPPDSIDLAHLLSKIETALIRRAFEFASGNKTKAAELLGLNRPRLYRRLEQLGLDDFVASDFSDLASDQQDSS